MKPQALTISALAIVLTLLFTSGVQAQQNFLFRVEVPFNFIAGENHLPSGQYRVFHIAPNLLQMQREDGRASTFISVQGSPVMSGNNRNQLVFNRYGDTYYLSQVATGQDEQIHYCYQSEVQRALEQQFGPGKAVTVPATTER
jgi:hypothetical protein